MPIITAPVELTKPQAGVITTNPATAPEQKPRMLGFPLTIHSAIGQTNEATAVAKVVVVNALAAMTSAATALPALNPYQPTHNIPVPIMQMTMLCGAMFSFPNPRRFPKIRQRIKADQPDVMCTTVPPAKSIALIFAVGFQTPFINPSIPQIMWACGKYTTNIQRVIKTHIAENFIRSAMAPIISAGVIIANINWYIAKTFWETQYE